MIPLRASMSLPPRTAPLVRLGLSPSSVSFVSVTSLASTSTMLLAAPPHSDPPSQTGFDVAGSIVGRLPAPCSVSGLSTTTFSVYVPGPIVIVAPGDAAPIAALMLVNAQPFAHTVFGDAHAELATVMQAATMPPTSNSRIVRPIIPSSILVPPPRRGLSGDGTESPANRRGDDVSEFHQLPPLQPPASTGVHERVTSPLLLVSL